MLTPERCTDVSPQCPITEHEGYMLGWYHGQVDMADTHDGIPWQIIGMQQEIDRLRRLVEMAYNEGVLDVFSRGATIQTAQDFWETADVKQCVLDPTADAELFGSTST